jgi:hypothetical protein
MFFSDVTSSIENNKGDSLQTTLMLGKGYTGFDIGLHDFHGRVNSLRIYSYTVSQSHPEYEMDGVKNQMCENQEVNYAIIDPDAGNDNLIQVNYEFWPYRLSNEGLFAFGQKQSGQSNLVQNKLPQIALLRSKEIGYYKLTLQTIGSDGNILKTSSTPFEIWVYPKEWYFEFY